ncbi:MAG: PepSY domain-containing protein [Caulobacterales bacterium]|nr:PepSY domain-containing protein [Caulobacterales bacterium]
MLRWSIQLHKWIALIVGIQVLFWVAGGVVMTVIPIERVRSEHHVAEVRPAPLAVEAAMPVAEVARRAGLRPVEAQLKTTPRGPVWSLKPASGDPVFLSATTGRPMAAMAAAEVQALAQRAYKGEGRTVSATLLAEAPQETGKTGPLWRVDFDDAEGTSFYLSPQTGEVVSRRSNVWRFYDFFWRLHIMDLEKGENFNHPLIIAAGILTLSIVVTGFILLWIRLARDLKMARAARMVRAGG